MYEQLVQIITQFYPQDQPKGIFLTSMNGSAVIESIGTLVTDRPWVEVLSKLYKASQQSSVEISVLICDIVIDIQEVTDYNELTSMNHLDIGLALMDSEGSQIGVLLPGTQGIQNLSQGLAYMKQKYQLQGMVSVFTFTTDRKVVMSHTPSKKK